MYLFPDCLILYCAEMHNLNMPQEGSSSSTTAKIGTFFSYLMFPFQSVFYVLLLFAWPLYRTALCLCLWSLCSWEGYIPVSSAKVHFVFLSCTVFIPACSITIGTIGSFSLFTAVKICSWLTTYFSNDGVIAEDHVRFYWFTGILLSTAGTLLNCQMSWLR